MGIEEVGSLTAAEILEIRKLLIQKDLIADAYKQAFDSVRKEMEASRREVKDDMLEIKNLVVLQSDRVGKLEKFMYIATGVVSTVLAVPTIAIVMNMLSGQGVHVP